jgi:uncharacterized protein
MSVALAVIAKSPLSGRVKTRLCPPCTPSEAAALADALLRDVVTAMLATPVARRVVVLDGRPPPWLPSSFEVVAQRGTGLDRRLAAAFADIGPMLVIAADTPQVRPDDLIEGLRALVTHDAVLGPSVDGGYWAIGLRTRRPQAFAGVPMSAPDTCAHQRRRMGELGLAVAELPVLRDVDVADDVQAVARLAPRSVFAACAGRLAA